MQEFSLHAGLSAQDFGPALAHLINLCSSPSKLFAEFVMNFGPRKTTRPVAHHYLRLVTNLVPSTLNEAKPIKSEMEVDDAPTTTEPEWMKDKKWTIQFQDTPDAAKRPTTTRTVLAAQVLNGNPLAFLGKLNQEYHYEYILKGHRLIHNNIIMTLFQIFKPNTVHEIKDGISAIDPSGGWILQAVVNVESSTEQQLVVQGVEELKTLKADLSQNLGLDLEVVDRMLLDTRTRAPGEP